MSVIRRHLPVLWPLGITPKQLMWVPGGTSAAVEGPSILPKDSSFCR